LPSRARTSLSAASTPVASPPGSSTDPRPDLKQAVWERLVSPAGGVPLVRTSGDGHTSDTPVFQARAEALLSACKDTLSPRDLVAEAALSGEDHAAHLAQLGLITRLPAPLTGVAPVMCQALQPEPWEPFADNTREAAQAALTALAKRWQDHRLEASQLPPYKRYAGTGRPTPRTPLQASEWPIQAHVQADDDTMEQDQHAKACDGLGTKIAARE
jgi:hypothetical protein